MNTSSPSKGTPWTRRFTPGSRVQVYYNPKSPEETYLIPEYMDGLSGRGISLIFISIGFGPASEWIGARHLGSE